MCTGARAMHKFGGNTCTGARAMHKFGRNTCTGARAMHKFGGNTCTGARAMHKFGGNTFIGASTMPKFGRPVQSRGNLLTIPVSLRPDFPGGREQKWGWGLRVCDFRCRVKSLGFKV
jgi:hypothetical protein